MKGLRVIQSQFRALSQSIGIMCGTQWKGSIAISGRTEWAQSQAAFLVRTDPVRYKKSVRRQVHRDRDINADARVRAVECKQMRLTLQRDCLVLAEVMSISVFWLAVAYMKGLSTNFQPGCK